MSTRTLIRSIQPMEETGPIVRCAPDVDLDALLLEVAADVTVADPFWFPFTDEPEDPATRINSTQREAHAGWFRTVPCPPNACGEHGFHLKPLGEDEPTGSARRGAWFGVWFL